MDKSQKIQSTTRKVPMAALYPLLEETLAQNGCVTLTITGSSMSPTFQGGRDRVTLCRPSCPLRKRDLPFYRRADGTFVLHRIMKVCPDGSYVCCGDRQTELETGIQPKQIVALATAFERKGRRFAASSRRYRLWVWLWCAVRPMRPVFFKLWALVRKLGGRRNS